MQVEMLNKSEWKELYRNLSQKTTEVVWYYCCNITEPHFLIVIVLSDWGQLTHAYELYLVDPWIICK